MKQNLQLRVSQNLALTPQLQQSIRLLQLSSLELDQELELILQENPLLEIVDENDETDSATEEQPASKEEPADSSTNDSEVDGSTSSDSQESSTSSETAEEAPISNEDFKQNDFDDDYEEYGSASNWDEGSKQNNSGDDDDFTREKVVEEDLRDHLLSQLKLMPLSDRDQKLVLLLIDSINEDGYLEES
jgi:RNA polymerase sigma-54 factor